jgi:hypothetical protein
MNISSETQNLISELNKFSNSKLKNISELTLLIESSAASEKGKLFEEIIFSAKYLNGLEKILQGNIVSGIAPNAALNGNKNKPLSNDARDKIKGEYKGSLKKLIVDLKELIGDFEEPEKTGFTEKFLSMNRESMLNLSRLIYDLAWVKTFKNKQRLK